MPCSIPFHLDRDWFLSDVVILADNADGKELHVSRTILGIFSSYFRAMFNSNFKEANETHVKILGEYDVMKALFRLVHHIDCDCPIEIEKDLLLEMYIVADMFDFPVVRFICRQKIRDPEMKAELDVFAPETVDRRAPCDIPLDLDKQWLRSDAAIKAKGADGKLLYVSTEILCMFSSIFCEMFRGRRTDEVVSVPWNYKVIKKIFQIIHHIDCEHILKDTKPPEMLMDIYFAMEKLGSSFLLKLLLDFYGLEIATKVHSLEMYDTLIDILKRMEPTMAKKFLSIEDSRPVFSKKDIGMLFKRFDDGTSGERFVYEQPPTDLEAASKALEIPARTFEPSKRSAGDVAIQTNGARMRMLYVKPKLLSFGRFPQYSGHFHLDVEYGTLRQILFVLSGNSLLGSQSPGRWMIDRLYDEAVLFYDMLLAVGEKKMNLSLVRAQVIAGLKSSRTCVALEVAIKLNLNVVKPSILANMPPGEIISWTKMHECSVCYMKGGRKEVISAPQMKRVLSINDLRIMYNKMHQLDSHITTTWY